LRAQLNTLQQQVMANSYSGFPMGTSSEESRAMEKEIQDLQAQLKVHLSKYLLGFNSVSLFP
jgi:hypothetical protein